MTDPLLDRLCALKRSGVPFDTAWAFATGGNRRAYFHPTERDDGTLKPADSATTRVSARGEEGEPFKRFVYRVTRAAYLDLPSGGGVALQTVRDLSDRDTQQARRQPPGKGAMAA